MKLKIIVVLVAGILGGCASYGTESIRNESDETLSQKLVKGVSTKAQVRAQLGDPSATSFTDSGNEQWTYFLGSYTPSPTNFVPYLNMVTSGGESQTKQANILFDKKGVVMNYSVTSGKQNINTGIIAAPVR
jgi:outer membrane protein assembly factor BamE (lipoprotein component of BamABCDE complex)